MLILIYHKTWMQTPAVTDRKEKPKQTISGNSETASWLWDILLTGTVLILLQIAALY